MQNDPNYIAGRIQNLRMMRGMSQEELGKRAGISKSAISKIENARREATASEIIRIAQAVGVTLDILVNGQDNFVYQEEIKVIEALREIPFDDYRSILEEIEYKLYSRARDAQTPLKEHLDDLVASLTHLAQSDKRPRTDFAERKRVKKEFKQSKGGLDATGETKKSS